MRSRITLGAALFVVSVLAACGGGAGGGGGGGGGGGNSAPPAAESRTWLMGFSPASPRPTTESVLQGIELWSQRAEFVAFHSELPWADLLNGMSPDDILDRDKVQLVDYLRSKGLKVYFMADVTDGLSRSDESPRLRALGRSFEDPDVQQLYRDYMLAVNRKLHPEFIGLAAETNLIRAVAPASLYAAVVTAANAAAADLLAAGTQATLMVSVQVETAWGLLPPGSYQGVETDFTDFPFLQMLGLSSYPYFAFAQPEDIPADYYSRVLNGHAVPVMVVEGGWTSAATGTIQSSPEMQARFITRDAQLLDSVGARGVVQLFGDLDLATFPPPIPPNLELFINIGLTDADFNPKPALGVWDELHKRPLVP